MVGQFYEPFAKPSKEGTNEEKALNPKDGMTSGKWGQRPDY